MILQQHTGWLALWGGALVAAFSPLAAQVLFAVIAIGIVGMAHGASDLEVVRRDRQLPFLAGYGLVIVLCLFWWHWSPAVALPGFLMASAVHFALEDAPHGHIAERLSRGISLIATPATLHLAEYRSILHQAGPGSAMPDSVTAGMAVAGGIAALCLVAAGAYRRERRLLVGTLTLLLLPPFVGFSMGFLILHALPQTRERRNLLGFSHYSDYLRAVWPVLVAAILLVVLTSFLMQPHDVAGIRSLFAALAALAIPHLIITPWFEKQSHSGWHQ
ncbi:Brp/Blh family beta-carotene 15,15'-dioxygenase [Erwinia sp. 198]|uniref:Brp/Blh family beta-carotene 15,15'-dioxygenase n=1 Tax=Erwinia sp. 198 TaxID=2022746 RepID=UPI000F65EB3D|nr:Brp/Blh family beta-carotene 15,15'-dioxygenase [Erwinia sp. 198]RRZ89334.1 hypothetical protein EGK14_15845 [Erwinia sp. 198]